MNGLLIQWFKHLDTVKGEQILPLPISFSNTNFLCFKILQAYNDNNTKNMQNYAMPVTAQSIKTFGFDGCESFFFAIGI